MAVTVLSVYLVKANTNYGVPDSGSSPRGAALAAVPHALILELLSSVPSSWNFSFLLRFSHLTSCSFSS